METIPHFHDGYVIGVRLREMAATIYLRQVDGSDFEVVLTSLIREGALTGSTRLSAAA